MHGVTYGWNVVACEVFRLVNRVLTIFDNYSGTRRRQVHRVRIPPGRIKTYCFATGRFRHLSFDYRERLFHSC